MHWATGDYAPALRAVFGGQFDDLIASLREVEAAPAFRDAFRGVVAVEARGPRIDPAQLESLRAFVGDDAAAAIAAQRTIDSIAAGGRIKWGPARNFIANVDGGDDFAAQVGRQAAAGIGRQVSAALQSGSRDAANLVRAAMGETDGGRRLVDILSPDALQTARSIIAEDIFAAAKQRGGAVAAVENPQRRASLAAFFGDDGLRGLERLAKQTDVARATPDAFRRVVARRASGDLAFDAASFRVLSDRFGGEQAGRMVGQKAIDAMMGRNGRIDLDVARNFLRTIDDDVGLGFTPEAVAITQQLRRAVRDSVGKSILGKMAAGGGDFAAVVDDALASGAKASQLRATLDTTTKQRAFRSLLASRLRDMHLKRGNAGAWMRENAAALDIALPRGAEDRKMLAGVFDLLDGLKGARTAAAGQNWARPPPPGMLGKTKEIMEWLQESTGMPVSSVASRVYQTTLRQFNPVIAAVSGMPKAVASAADRKHMRALLDAVGGELSARAIDGDIAAIKALMAAMKNRDGKGFFGALGGRKFWTRMMKINAAMQPAEAVEIEDAQNLVLDGKSSEEAFREQFPPDAPPPNWADDLY